MSRESWPGTGHKAADQPTGGLDRACGEPDLKVDHNLDRPQAAIPKMTAYMAKAQNHSINAVIITISHIKMLPSSKTARPQTTLRNDK